MSTTQETAKLLTAEDLLAMPDRKRYELVNGELREKQVSVLSSLVAIALAARLQSFVEPRKLAWVFGADCGFRIGNGIVRMPDVSVVLAERLPASAIGSGWLTMAPDLAVEVVSPNDLVRELETKIEQLLEAGTRLVWIVNPMQRTVRIHRADGTVALRRVGETLDGEDVLPGFQCVIASLFPTVDSSSA